MYSERGPVNVTPLKILDPHRLEEPLQRGSGHAYTVPLDHVENTKNSWPSSVLHRDQGQGRGENPKRKRGNWRSNQRGKRTTEGAKGPTNRQSKGSRGDQRGDRKGRRSNGGTIEGATEEAKRKLKREGGRAKGQKVKRSKEQAEEKRGRGAGKGAIKVPKGQSKKQGGRTKGHKRRG